jgi:imidazolonepropionase-like amidohydrolase
MTGPIPKLYLFLGIFIRLSLSCLHGTHPRVSLYTPSYVEHQVRTLQARKAAYEPKPKPKIALINVRVFDGYIIHNPSTVIIDGDVIGFDIRDVNSIIDGQGGILLPGLIDSHCHVSSLADLEALSRYGVTTGMNMNCQNYTLCNYLRNQVGLTSLFTAGIAAVAPNSTHAKLFSVPGNPQISSPSQAPQFVDNVFRNGSDYMKLVSESSGFDQATHNTLVNATHALGKQAMTHAADLASYQVAITSKTNGLQHIPFDSPLTEGMAAQMKAHNQFVTPTLNIGKVVSANMTLKALLSGSGTNVSYGTGVTGVRVCKQAGVSILAGTDAISTIRGVNDPLGLTLHLELENLVEAGLSNAEALRSATMVPARWHNLMDRGAIRQGMRADLLLLKPGSNPLVNISKTLDISRVWNGGVEFTSLVNA